MSKQTARKYVRKSNEEKRQEIEKITRELDEQVGKIFDSDNYKNYLSWSAGKELNDLKKSMETIRKTASYIITGIENKMLEKTSIKDKLAAAGKKAEVSKEHNVKSKQVSVLA